VIASVLGCRPSAPTDTPQPQPEPVRAGAPTPPADAIATPSGLRYRIVAKGEGAPVDVADEVKVRYRVMNTRGEVVAHSDEPESLQMTALPKGWAEGMQLLAPGGRAELWLPAALGYGEGDGVTHGDLYVEVELVDVVRAPQWAASVLPFDAPPPGAQHTPSGLAYVVIRKGTGTEHPRAGMKISAHYNGWHTDGKLFDSSYERGEPISFRTDQVIAGWTEGLALMVVGEKTRFWIPEALAYKGAPGRPAGMLVFDIELLALEP
jgi:FKBP-type peptidyl-prolyl cis-trans isomerase